MGDKEIIKPRILFIDASNLDILCREAARSDLPLMAADHGIDPGDKYTCKTGEFARFKQAAASLTQKIYVGGSAANAARGLAAIVSGNAEVVFCTNALTGVDGRHLMKYFEEDKITLKAIEPPPELNAIEPPQSLVFLPQPGADRIVVKCGSTFPRKVLTVENIPADLIHAADIVVLQGSMIAKLGLDVFHHVLKNMGSADLCLALPTDLDCGAEHRDLFLNLSVRVASVVSANRREFLNIFGGENPEYGLRLIQDAWRSEPREAGARERMALITDGESDAYLLTEFSGIRRQTPLQVEYMDSFGGGDAAFAGLLTGFVLGMGKDAGDIAMTLGAAKVQEGKGACLHDPIQSLLNFGGAAVDRLCELIGLFPEDQVGSLAREAPRPQPAF